MSDNQTIAAESSKWGGARKGAGRPIGARDAGTRLSKSELERRIARLNSLGVLAGTARRVIEALGGDEYFVRLITRLEEEGDTSTAAKLWWDMLQMRDGRPAQQINVTSMNVHVTADEIARARAVVREIVGAPKALTGQVVESKGDSENYALAGQGAEKGGG